MNWDRIESNWAQFTGNVEGRWGELTDRQLTDVVQETYGTTDGDDDGLRPSADWQQRLSEIKSAAR